MLTRRPADERGHADHGWLDSRHSFSFASYYDPQHMGFRDLRVINDDRIAGGAGFPTHPHRDMEIITYVVEGALEHRDSMGNGSVIRPGDVQRMTAGTGVTHSEFNHEEGTPLRLLQIWILPERPGLEPGYGERSFSESSRRNQLRLVASRDRRDDSVRIHQDVSLYATLLDPGAEVTHTLATGRHAWLQVIDGDLVANGTRLGAGDGAAISGDDAITLRAETPAHALLFDLA